MRHPLTTASEQEWNEYWDQYWNKVTIAAERDLLVHIREWLRSYSTRDECFICQETLTGCDMGHDRSPRGIARAIDRLIALRPKTMP